MLRPLPYYLSAHWHKPLRSWFRSWLCSDRALWTHLSNDTSETLLSLSLAAFLFYPPFPFLSLPFSFFLLFFFSPFLLLHPTIVVRSLSFLFFSYILSRTQSAGLLSWGSSFCRCIILLASADIDEHILLTLFFTQPTTFNLECAPRRAAFLAIVRLVLLSFYSQHRFISRKKTTISKCLLSQRPLASWPASSPLLPHCRLSPNSLSHR